MRTIQKALLILLALALALFAAGCSARAGTGAPTPTAEPTATPAPTPPPTPQPTPEPVEIAGLLVAGDTEELTLSGVDGTAEELRAALAKLPALKRVDVTGWPLSNEEELALREAYPDIDFLWDVDVCGRKISSAETYIILDDIPLESVEPVESVLPLLGHAEQIDMCRCGIDDETMYAFRERTSSAKIVWLAKLGVCDVRTDETQFCHNLQGKYSKCRDELLVVQMKYFPDLIALDLGHCNYALQDCSWLQYTPKLQILILAVCCLTDISPIANLHDLIYLELFNNDYLADISPLAGLENLKDLNLSRTQVADLTPLYSCKNLERLWVHICLKLTEEEVAACQEALPNCEISYNNSDPTNGWRSHERYYWMRDIFGGNYM